MSDTTIAAKEREVERNREQLADTVDALQAKLDVKTRAQAKLQETKEGELRTRQQEIKDLQTKINEGRLSLAQDKLSGMEKDLEDRVIALRRLQDDANRDLTKKREELLGQIDQRVMPVINQIGKEQGYTLIFRKFESGLIYADEAVDITKLVVQRLDAAGAQGK